MTKAMRRRLAARRFTLSNNGPTAYANLVARIESGEIDYREAALRFIPTDR